MVEVREQTATQSVDRVAEVRETMLPKETILPREVVSQLENHQLKLQNFQLQLQVMQSKLHQINTSRGELIKEMEAFRTRVLNEHGVDVAMTMVQPDGTVRPLTQQEIRMLTAERGM